MKNAPPPSEVVYVRGGLAAENAQWSVDPAEDPEDARRDAARRGHNKRVARQKKRRRWEKKAT